MTDSTEPNLASMSLEDYMREEFELGHNADIEVHADGQVFKINKTFLFMQSDVFKAMFVHDSEVKRTNIVSIKNHDASVVKQFLLYFYTRKVDNLDQVATQMFELADFYQVKNLRQLSISSIFSNLNTQNVYECYEMASKFDLNNLKKKAEKFMKISIGTSTMFNYYELAKKHKLNGLVDKVLKFIKANTLDVVKSEEWKKFDMDFKFGVLQEFAEKASESRNGKEIPLKIKLLHIFKDGNNGIAELRLKNIGKKRVAFKLQQFKDSANIDIYFTSDHKQGFIKPNRTKQIEIDYSNFTFFNVMFEETDEVNIKDCFDDDFFVRQFSVEL